VARQPGLSVRVKLTLSYAGFLTLAGSLLLGVTWFFQVRARSSLYIPGIEDYLRVFDTRNFGPRVFLPAAIVALTFMLVFGLVGGWLLAGRMLAPVNRITAAARRADSGSLAHRITMPGRDDEFRELADAFDGMLDRLEAHVAEQRRFAANASHELRTPLAVTQTLLEVAGNDPDHQDDELLQRLRVVNARAIDLTEALLVLSRADQGSFTPEEVDLSLLAEQAAETLLPLAEKHGVSVETSGDIAPATGAPSLLLQLTTNLLHNAIVHNLGEGGTVRISTVRISSVRISGEAGTDAVRLTVENTGDPLDPELVATFTEPFQRGTGRIRADHAGVGLGLTIARSIAQAHQGELTLSPRPGGGLRAVVDLPSGRRPAIGHGQKESRAGVHCGRSTIPTCGGRAPSG